MTAQKISVRKAAFSNIYVTFSQSVKQLRDDVTGWHSWQQATAEGHAQWMQKKRVLGHQEATLRALEDLVTSKTHKNPRAKEGGQSSRNLLVRCPECDYKCRITAMWIDVGIPKCPNPNCSAFDSAMQQDESFHERGEISSDDLNAAIMTASIPQESFFGLKCIAHGALDCPICSTI